MGAFTGVMGKAVEENLIALESFKILHNSGVRNADQKRLMALALLLFFFF